MKKSIRRLIGSLAVLALLSSVTFALAVSSEPAAGHAVLWQEPIYIEDVQAGFLNEQGRNIQPFSYKGTIYMPLRTVGEWMGCQVAWEQETQTVSLTSGGEPQYLNIFTPEAQPGVTEEEFQQLKQDLANGIDIQTNPSLTVELDGVKQEFKNAAGEPVYPVVFRGSVYLPVRSVGELCGKEVLWMPAKNPPYDINMVFIYDAPTEQQKEEIRTYTADCDRYYTDISAAVDTLTAAENLSTEEALVKLFALKEMIQDLRNLPQPSAPFFKGYACYYVKVGANDLERSTDEYISCMSGETASPNGTDWNSQREYFSDIIGQYVISFQGGLKTIHYLVNTAGI